MNKPKCIFTKRGRYEYGGSQSTTCTGRQCVVWGTEYENNGFPLDVGVNVSELQSCRNPDLKAMGEWCLVSGMRTVWDENCCIPPCSGQYSTRFS